MRAGRAGRRAAAAAGGVLLLAVGAFAGALWSGRAPADWGAAAILHPVKRPVTRHPPLPFENVSFESGGERLEGWLFRTTGRRRGLVVYLHGIADNRQSGIGAAKRLTARGYDVLAFDGRAHGRSTGQACTYGFHERHDVSRALDAVGAPSAILLGHSLGASIALQAAAVDGRVAAVVAVSPFSDLPTIVRERAHWFLLPGAYVEAALARAGEQGRFVPAQASPVALAPRIEAPVLLVHGASDVKTPPDHSRRIAAGLRCPHRLVILAGAGHDEILGREETWQEIEAFLRNLESSPLDASLRPAAPSPPAAASVDTPGDQPSSR
jgi:hypothetical protein